MKFKEGDRYFQILNNSEKVENYLKYLGRLAGKTTSAFTIARIIENCILNQTKVPNWLLEGMNVHLDSGFVINIKEEDNGEKWVRFNDDKLGRMNIRFESFMKNYRREDKNNPYKHKAIFDTADKKDITMVSVVENGKGIVGHFEVKPGSKTEKLLNKFKEASNDNG